MQNLNCKSISAFSKKQPRFNVPLYYPTIPSLWWSIKSHIMLERSIRKHGNFVSNGKYVKELENRLAEFLGVRYLLLVTNGTIGLEMAFNALGLKGEVITTPYSYIASTSSIAIRNLEPRFVDIDPETLNIDTGEIESAITTRTSAIVPVHLYGNPANVFKIQEIANKHNLKVIYDSAHCFNIFLEGKNIFEYGDISCGSLSFAKPFSTLQGGILVTNDVNIYRKLKKMRHFGKDQGENLADIELVGTNAKVLESTALDGIYNLKLFKRHQKIRKRVHDYYYRKLKGYVGFPKHFGDSNRNYGYFPIIFSSEEDLIKTQESLHLSGFQTIRNFYPILTELKYIKDNSNKFPNALSLSKRILCLPIHHKITNEQQNKIIEIIISNLRAKYFNS